MSDDEILQLASQTSGAHYMDHAHVIRFARAVMRKTAGSESAPLHNAARNVLMAWDMYGTAECLRGWIDIMRDTLNAPPCHAASNAPDHREVMRQALDALDLACAKYGEVGGADTDWGRWDAAATALRAALASDAMDRLAQADRELGLGERA
jgi:hypothetical protein